MEELTDKQILDALPRLGYFPAQADCWGRIHICQPQGALKAVGLCGTAADPTMGIRKESHICGRCRPRIIKAVRAHLSDQEKLKRWTK